MSDWNTINCDDLDNYITGHYGEDQFDDDDDYCAECGDRAEFIDSYGMSLCATHAMIDTERLATKQERRLQKEK